MTLSRGLSHDLTLAVTCGLTLLPTLSFGQTAEPITLRLVGLPGTAATYRHEKQQSVRLPDELGGAATTRTVLLLEQAVEASGPDSIVVVSSIERFRFEVEPRPDRMPDLGRLEGLRFRATSTPSGRIYRVEIEGAPGEVARPLRRQIENWLRELGFPTLPVGPARVGESWKDTTRVPLAALLGLQGEAEAIEVRTTTFTSLDESAEGWTATLVVQADWTGSEDGEATGVRVRGSSRQEARFAVEAGHFLHSRGESSIGVEIASGSGMPPVRIDARGTYETRLLPEPE